ncbi:hypothetical protein J2Y69_002140 [Microbacterium resistens]|uniref:Minor tail protein n=1 Tax=Microbacterium resistens TaxID=156977 RepID=A0ABU1SD57_9MICO|nr:hypothetical protein [Microbacterium resistens]MDR6867536.1 hypothetical protein [Microbacterium resistens]
MDYHVEVSDGITGTTIDRIPVTRFTWERLLSAGGDGQATIPLGGAFSTAALRDLTRPWSRKLSLHRFGRVEFDGYITSRAYNRGSNTITVGLGDLWSLLRRRIAVDHSVSGAERWQATVTGSLAVQANAAIVWARDTYTGIPWASFPLTIPGHGVEPVVTRTYYGYHLRTVMEHIQTLMDEGLDVYFRPWVPFAGTIGWYMHAGIGWTSGVTWDAYATAARGDVTKLSVTEDASRVINNSIRVGEGSEVDMLTRSNVNATSGLPLLERVTQSKTISDGPHLEKLTLEDLRMYGGPTEQWDVAVPADHPVDIGDTMNILMSGDAWVPDGQYFRRVVKTSGDLAGVKTIGLQPVGGA